MEFIKRDSTALDTLTSINNSSVITINSTASSVESKIGTDDEAPNASFLVKNEKTLHKLMEDLSIIDNVFDLLEIKNEVNTYGNVQV